MSFESHAPNIANLQNYLNEEKSRQNYGDGPTWWSIPAGMSSIRILPPWDPSGRIALAVNMHPIEYQNSTMKYKKYNWTCVNKTFGKPCKICEGLAEMAAAGVDISKMEANRRQFYMNAIVMHDPRYQASIAAGKTPEQADGVAPGTHVLLKSPKTLYDWVISQITNPMVGDITSLTQGIDIYVTKEGSGLGTKYTPTLSPNGRSAVPQEYLDKIQALYNLDEIFSTGFDDALIAELVDHLKKSAGAIANNVPTMVNQMAGYNPMPTPAVAPMNPGMAPMNTSPQMGGYVPQSTSSQPVTGNFPQAVNPLPTMTNPTYPSSSQPNVGMPGQYTGTPAPSPIAPSPFGAGKVVSSGPSIPPAVNLMPPFGASAGPDYGTPVPTNPTPAPTPAASSPSPMEMNLPKCFGQYNPSNVTCVVCPAEVNCSQKSANR